jgi:hypothetical protein
MENNRNQAETISNLERSFADYRTTRKLRSRYPLVLRRMACEALTSGVSPQSVSMATGATLQTVEIWQKRGKRRAYGKQARFEELAVVPDGFVKKRAGTDVATVVLPPNCRIEVPLRQKFRR